MDKIIIEEISNNLPKHTEYETKYQLKGEVTMKFKNLVMSFTEELGDFDFIYAEGPDYYYTKKDNSFMRYRKAINGKEAWVTMKEKRESRTNINRKEVNWRVDKTPYDTIHEGALMQGYDFNFKIWKICHIYKFKEATLVLYSVTDDNDKTTQFMEIELDEDTIHLLTEEKARNKIRKIEAMLEPLGITHRNRLSKSLYEMYRKDINAE